MTPESKDKSLYVWYDRVPEWMDGYVLGTVLICTNSTKNWTVQYSSCTGTDCVLLSVIPSG